MLARTATEVDTLLLVQASELVAEQDIVALSGDALDCAGWHLQHPAVKIAVEPRQVSREQLDALFSAVYALTHEKIQSIDPTWHVGRVLCVNVLPSPAPREVRVVDPPLLLFLGILNVLKPLFRELASAWRYELDAARRGRTRRVLVSASMNGGEYREEQRECVPAALASYRRVLKIAPRLGLGQLHTHELAAILDFCRWRINELLN